MTIENKLSRTLRTKLEDFLATARAGGIPDPGSEFLGGLGLSLEARRVVWIMKRYEMDPAETGVSDQVEPSKTGTGQPSELDTKPTKEPVASMPQQSGPASRPISRKWEPSEFGSAASGDAKELNGELEEAVSEGAAEKKKSAAVNNASLPATSEASHEESRDRLNPGSVDSEGGNLDGESEGCAQSVPQNASSEGDLPVANDPEQVTGGTISVPQSGGVPAVPTQTTISVNPLRPVRKSVYLRNAKVNEAYEGKVEIQGLKSLKLIEDGGTTLLLDEETGLLTGTPAVSGDFSLRLKGLLDGTQCEVTANLAVIPDPKSMWVSKDSDKGDQFWKPDAAFEQLESDLLCIAASKRGRSHANIGSFRDDDFGLSATDLGGWHIAVVADGAGSAKFSRQGSKVAVNSVLQGLPQKLKDEVSPQLPKLVPAFLNGNKGAEATIKKHLYNSLVVAAFDAAKAIEIEAELIEAEATEFSTTLIVSVVIKIPEGWFIAGFSIGDGGAAVLNIREETLATLTRADSGEFAGQTRFLQRSEFKIYEEVEKRIYFNICSEFTAIALMTDGISDPKFPTESEFVDPKKWMEFWNDDLSSSVDFSRTNSAMEEQFLDWMDFWSPGNHDDRTLVILVP